MPSEEKLVNSQSYHANFSDTLIPVKDSTVCSEENNQRSFFCLSSLMRKFQGGTVNQALITFIAATMGTGALMVSNSFAPSGIIWATIQTIFCGWICYYSLITLVECGSDLKVYTYQEVATQVFGSWFKHVFNVCCFCCGWGSTIIFIQIANELFAAVCNIYGGDVLPTWLTDPESKLLTILQATLLVYPLSVPKEFKSLKYFCFVNLVLILIFCYAIAYEGFDYQPITQSFKTVSMFALAGFTTTFPSAIYNMTPHLNVLTVFKELKSSTIYNMRIVVGWTILFALAIFILVGILGYVPFSSNIDILSSETYADGVILVAYGYTLKGLKRVEPFVVILSMITMFASVIISQPFNIRPAKDSFRSAFRSLLKKMKIIQSDAETDPESLLERAIYVFGIVYSSVLVVLYSDNIQTAMNILGSSFIALICFIFPSLFYLKIRKDTMRKSEKVIHWSIVVGVSIFAVWATVENIMQSV